MSAVVTGRAPAGAPPAGKGPAAVLGWHAVDVLAAVGRSLRRSLRTPDTLVTGIALPVVLMLMFVYVFGGAIDPSGGYVNYVVPGIVLLCAGFGASATAVSVAQDMTGGLMNRFRSMPMRPSTVLTGHVVESLARNAVSTVLVVGVALLAGFRPTASAGLWFATAALVGAYVLALTWVAVGIGLVASGPEAANGFSFAVMFLPYLSSAFVPPSTMPRALEWVATYQPISPIIDTVRSWLIGVPGGRPWLAAAWCVGMLVVARLAAVALFRRRSAH
ncbi:MAG TPA: ABC transporter permease [Actinotalea sp.]|nr:ABC transporter permease [Actinotalea sp.]